MSDVSKARRKARQTRKAATPLRVYVATSAAPATGDASDVGKAVQAYKTLARFPMPYTLATPLPTPARKAPVRGYKAIVGGFTEDEPNGRFKTPSGRVKAKGSARSLSGQPSRPRTEVHATLTSRRNARLGVAYAVSRTPQTTARRIRGKGRSNGKVNVFVRPVSLTTGVARYLDATDRPLDASNVRWVTGKLENLQAQYGNNASFAPSGTRKGVMGGYVAATQ